LSSGLRQSRGGGVVSWGFARRLAFGDCLL
jgi:hypothetical protein